jgi:hypothetical protein
MDGGPAHGTESMSCTFAIATVEERWRKKGLKKGEVRPLSLSASLSLSSVCSSEGRREEEEDNSKVSRTTPPLPPYLTAAARRIPRGGSKSTAFNEVDTADTDSWAPRLRKRACVRSNYSRMAPKAVQAHCIWRPITLRLPAPFHLPESATTKGAPALHASGHDAHYSMTPRAMPKTVTEYSPSGGSLPTKEQLFRALLNQGFEGWPV